MKIIFIVVCVICSIFSQQLKYVSDGGGSSDAANCGATEAAACATIAYAFGNEITNASAEVTVSIIGVSTVNKSVVFDATAGPRIINSSTPIGSQIKAVSNSTESYIQTAGNLTFINIKFSFASLGLTSTDPSFISVVGSHGFLNLTNIILSADGTLNARFLNFTTDVDGTLVISNFTVANITTSRMIIALNGTNAKYIANINNLQLSNISQGGEKTLDELIYLVNTTTTLTNATFDTVSNNNSNVLMAVDGSLTIVNSNFKNTDGSKGTLMYICFMCTDMKGTFNLTNGVFTDLKVVQVAIHLHMAGAVSISNSSFKNLSSVQGGGAVRLEDAMNIRVATSNFTNCTSTGGDGGALYVGLMDGHSNYTLDTLVFDNNTDFEGNISHVLVNGTNFQDIIKPEKFVNITPKWSDFLDTANQQSLYWYYGCDRSNNGGNDNNTAGTRESIVPFLICANGASPNECPIVLCQFVPKENGTWGCTFDDTCAGFFPTEETDSCPWDCRIELENWVCVRQCTEGFQDIRENCVEDKCQLNKPNATFQCDPFEGTACYAQDTSCKSQCADGYQQDDTLKQCSPICPALYPVYSHRTENMHCPDPCWVEEYSCVDNCNSKLYNSIDVAEHVCYRRECSEITPTANGSCPFGCLYQEKKGKGTCNLHCEGNYLIDATNRGTCIYDPEKKRANITVAIIVVILVIIVIAVVICICWRIRHPDLSQQQRLPADLYGGKTVQPVSSLFGGVGSSNEQPHQAVTERVDFFSDDNKASVNSSLSNSGGAKKGGATYGSF